MFFTWIIGLATVIAVLYPFSTTAPLSQEVATAVINLVLGAAIGSLINGTAARVIRRRAITGDCQPSYPSPGDGQDHAGTPRPDALIPAPDEGQLAALREMGREWDPGIR